MGARLACRFCSQEQGVSSCRTGQRPAASVCNTPSAGPARQVPCYAANHCCDGQRVACTAADTCAGYAQGVRRCRSHVQGSGYICSTATNSSSAAAAAAGAAAAATPAVNSPAVDPGASTCKGWPLGHGEGSCICQIATVVFAHACCGNHSWRSARTLPCSRTLGLTLDSWGVQLMPWELNSYLLAAQEAVRQATPSQTCAVSRLDHNDWACSKQCAC